MIANDSRVLYSGRIRLHILYQAGKGSIFGLEMIVELGRQRCKLSTGIRYPLLHGLESRGLLYSSEKKVGRVRRRLYRATPAGRKALRAAKEKVRQLFSELLEETM